MDASMKMLPTPYVRPPPISVDACTAGAWAGIISETLLHPFDTVSTRLKAQVFDPPKYSSFTDACRTILREEGTRGFYGGVGATIIFQGPATAIYFGAYEFFKSYGAAALPASFEPAVILAAGAFAEVTH